MAIVINEQVTNTANSGTTITLTFATAPSASEMILVVLAGANGSSWTYPGTGPVFTAIQAGNGVWADEHVIYAVGNGVTTSFTFTGVGVNQGMCAWGARISGMDMTAAHDQLYTGGTGSAGSSPYSFTLNTSTFANELWLLALATGNYSTNVTTGGLSFTNGYTAACNLSSGMQNSASGNLMIGTKIVTATGLANTTATWTGAEQGFGWIFVALKASGGNVTATPATLNVATTFNTPGSWTLVQAPTPIVATAVTTQAIALTNVSIGDLVVVAAHTLAGGTISDNLASSGSWVQPTGSPFGTDKHVWYKVSAAAGPMTITVATGGAAANIGVAARQYQSALGTPLQDLTLVSVANGGGPLTQLLSVNQQTIETDITGWAGLDYQCSRSWDSVNFHGAAGPARPFASSSLWNTPIVPAVTTYATVVNLPSTLGWFNCWSGLTKIGHPVYYGLSSDPIQTFNVPNSWGWSAGTLTLHAPASMTQSIDSDHIIVLIDTTVSPNVVYNFWNTTGSAGGPWGCGAWAKCNITDSGFGTYSPFLAAGTAGGGANYLGGTITGTDITAGVIDHGLFLGCIPTMATNGFIAPMISTDFGFNGAAVLKYGSRLAIPPVAYGGPVKPGLHTVLGGMLWDALVKYGCILSEHLGGNAIAFYGDPTSLANSGDTGDNASGFFWAGGGLTDCTACIQALRLVT